MGGSKGTPSRTAAYVRVSTDEQSHASQETEIRKWLDQHGIRKVQWFVDTQSGSTVNRAAFRKLNKAIHAGKIDTVVIYKLDRLSRSLRDGVNIIGDWLDQGVRLVSVTQQMDLSGVMGRTMAALLLGLAEMEREYIRERQIHGIEQARKAGKLIGRPVGFRKKSPKRVKELRDRGLTQQEIAESLGIGRRTVIRYLQEIERQEKGDGDE